MNKEIKNYNKKKKANIEDLDYKILALDIIIGDTISKLGDPVFEKSTHVSIASDVLLMHLFVLGDTGTEKPTRFST